MRYFIRELTITDMNGARTEFHQHPCKPSMTYDDNGNPVLGYVDVTDMDYGSPPRASAKPARHSLPLGWFITVTAWLTIVALLYAEWIGNFLLTL